MRRGRVVLKLWLAFVGLVIVVLVPLELALHQLLTDFYSRQATDPLLHHSHQLARMLADDPEAIQGAAVMGQMVGGEVAVLDRFGVPISFPGSSQLPIPADIRTKVLSGADVVGQAELRGEPYVIAGAALPGQRGAVLLMAPAQPLQRSLEQARRYLWLAGIGTLLLGTGTALLLARNLLRPVMAIEQATRSIARGDLTTRVHVASHDEIGDLAEAVNRMTEQLQSYEGRRQEFLSNVAHELRTPLSYVRGYTQALNEGMVASEEDRLRYQSIVHEEAVRLGRLVDDLLDLAQMEQGELAFDFGPLDLRLPVEQAVATVRPKAMEKGVVLEVQVPATLPLVRGDGGRLQQVVFNLLDNGLRHAPPGSAVLVHARAGNGSVTLSVTDRGPGVDPDLLPLVFERFQKRHAEGRGLGLAIVQSIVRRHGGTVSVESRPGEGATFSFTIPIEEDHE